MYGKSGWRSGWPPCSPQMPIFKPGCDSRPVLTAYSISLPTPWTSKISKVVFQDTTLGIKGRICFCILSRKRESGLREVVGPKWKNSASPASRLPCRRTTSIMVPNLNDRFICNWSSMSLRISRDVFFYMHQLFCRANLAPWSRSYVDTHLLAIAGGLQNGPDLHLVNFGIGNPVARLYVRAWVYFDAARTHFAQHLFFLQSPDRSVRVPSP